MLDQLKKIYFKKYCDYSHGSIDAREFYKTFFKLLKTFGVLDEPVLKWTIILKIIISLLTVSAVMVLSTGMYHGVAILNLPFFTESGTYFLVMTYGLLILSCTQRNLKDYHGFLRIMRDDFKYACIKGGKYRKKFFEGQIHTWKLSIIIIGLVVSTASSMVFWVIASSASYLVLHNLKDGGRPRLPFPFWFFDVDFEQSPVYEIVLVYSIVCIMAYCFYYVFMILTEIVMIREIAIKADIVMLCIEDLLNGIHAAKNIKEKEEFDALIKYRMIEIVRNHQSMDILIQHYANIYRKLLMFEQAVCAPVVCLSAYSSLEQWNEGELNPILVLLCMITIFVIFVPSYLCTFLSAKVSSICYACWSIPFWNASPVIRPFLVLIMQRSLRPLPLKTAGFDEVSLQTFSTKMTSAYSYFNMLRQAKS